MSAATVEPSFAAFELGEVVATMPRPKVKRPRPKPTEPGTRELLLKLERDADPLVSEWAARLLESSD